MIRSDPVAIGAEALAEGKALLRIEGDGEDPLMERLIGSAAELCEEFTRQRLIARSFREILPASGAWQRLAATPVLAITGVEGLPAEGAPFPIPAGRHGMDIDAAGDGWVRLTAPAEAKRIVVSYRAGLAAAWDEVPDALRHGITRLAAHFYSHRDGDAGAAPPAAVTALWRPWRRMRID